MEKKKIKTLTKKRGKNETDQQQNKKKNKKQTNITKHKHAIATGPGRTGEECRENRMEKNKVKLGEDRGVGVRVEGVGGEVGGGYCKLAKNGEWSSIQRWDDGAQKCTMVMGSMYSILLTFKESSSNPYDRDVLAAFDAHVIRSVFTPRQEETQPVMMTPRAPARMEGAEILARRSPTGDHASDARRRRPFGSGRRTQSGSATRLS